MAFNVAMLLNSDASDRAQIDSLIEEYFLEEVTNESEADDDEDDNFANYITDEDDDFDFRQNNYDMATMQVADRSVETLSDSPDEELPTFSY